MPYRTNDPTLSVSCFRAVLVMTMIAGLAACKTNEARGVLAAKFVDGSDRFVKRITISTAEGAEFRLSLVSRTKRCELAGRIPAALVLAQDDCKGVSGTASLRCEESPEIPLLWRLTSCHSGYGRSLSSVEPAFLFGFSGNLYTAQDQLQLAPDAIFDSSDNACTPQPKLDQPEICMPSIAAPAPPLLEQP